MPKNYPTCKNVQLKLNAKKNQRVSNYNFKLISCASPYALGVIMATTTRIVFEEVGSVAMKAGCFLIVQSINTLTFPYVNSIPG